MWHNIKSNLIDLQEQHVPSKLTTTRFHLPWITTEIKRISRRKQRAYNICRNKPTISREHRKHRELQKQTKQLLKSAYDTYINNLISPDNSTNPKRLYTYIKHQRNDQSGIQQLQDKDGFIRSDSLTKANILNQHFPSVFTQNEDTSTIPDKGASPAHHNNTRWHPQTSMHTQRTQSIHVNPTEAKWRSFSNRRRMWALTGKGCRTCTARAARSLTDVAHLNRTLAFRYCQPH